MEDHSSKWAQYHDLYKLYDLFCFCNLAKDWSAAEKGLGDVNVNFFCELVGGGNIAKQACYMMYTVYISTRTVFQIMNALATDRGNMKS